MAQSRYVLESIVIATGVLATVFGLLWYKKQKTTVPKRWKRVGKVKSLFIYPLKSGFRIELENALCTEYGMKMPQSQSNLYQLQDRSFIVYKEENNEFLTARQHPHMIFIKVKAADGKSLQLSAPDMPNITVTIPEKEKIQQTEVIVHKGEKIRALDCGDTVAAWLSQYIIGEQSGLRLGFHDGQLRRNINETHNKYFSEYPKLRSKATGMYSDLSSFTVMNQASVDELSSRIPQSNVSVNNFRPNILVEGDIPPFAEDDWKWLKIGDVILYTARYCTRCVFTTIDTNTGIKSSENEPLRTLRKYRMVKDIKGVEIDGNLPVMGINMGLECAGEISIGDEVYVSN